MGATSQLAIPGNRFARSRIFVPGTGSEPRAATGTATISGSVSNAILPRSALRQQIAAFRVTLAGARLRASLMTGQIRVIQKTNGLASWAITMPVHGDGLTMWPAGNPWAANGPPTGLGAVNIEGVYVTDAGLLAYPLITNGIADQAEVKTGEAGDVLTLSGIGPGGRYQRKEIVYSLDAGHTKRADQVIREMAVLAGVTNIDLPRMPVRPQAVVVNSSSWLSTKAKPLAEPSGYHVGWNEEAALTVFPRLADTDRGLALTLYARDLVAGATRKTFESDSVTRLVLTATLPKSADECGVETTGNVTESYELRLPQRCPYRIAAGGALISIPPPSGESEQLMLHRRVTTRVTTECGTRTLQYTKVEGPKLPQAWRYIIDTTGAVTAHNVGAYVLEADADTSGGGGEPAYLWGLERWQTLSEEWQRPSFADGYEAGETIEAKGWMWRRERLKERSPGFTDWDSEPYANGQKIMGAGEGTRDDAEHYSASTLETNGWLERRVTEVTVLQGAEDTAYKTSENSTDYAWRLREGNKFWFSEELQSSDARDYWLPYAATDITYQPVGEGAQSVTSKSDLLKISDQTTGVDIAPLDGYLPAASKQGTVEDQGRAANEPIAASCMSSLLESSRPVRDETASVQYVTGESELESLCAQRLREGATVDIRLRVPALFPLKKGQQIQVVLPRIGLDSTVLVEEIRHDTQGAGSPILTNITGKARTI